MSQEQDLAQEDAPGVTQVPLKTLNLRPGIALQVRRLVEGATKKEAQLFGAIESKGVMVGPQGPEGEDPGLAEGEVCIVRGFNGQHEFSFISKVLQIFQTPFAYALLAYPAQVDARQVRQSMRTKTSWPIHLHVNDEIREGNLVDLSPQGAMVTAAIGPVTIGTLVGLEIHATVDEEPTTITVAAKVCHSNRAASGDACITGMAFQGVTKQDKLILHYLTQTSPA